MGTFRKRIEIGNTDGGDSMEVDAAVDTGAAHSMFPSSLLIGLRVEPVANRQFRFADGNAANLDVGLALITIDSEQWPCPVLFSPGLARCCSRNAVPVGRNDSRNLRPYGGPGGTATDPTNTPGKDLLRPK